MMSGDTPKRRALDCMIVGGHKCGTTSLKEYLAAHPGVVTHPQIEFTAFAEREYSETREAEELGKLLSAAGDRLALAKHAGLYSEPLALDRLRDASPGCKLLLILRDPVARARSAFRMESLRGADQEPFDAVAARAIEMDREGREDWRVRVYLHMGLYGRWLGEIRRRFAEEQVMVVFQEELAADPAACYEELCRWLGLDPGFSPDLSVRHNIGADPRSERLARAIKRLQAERNLVKRTARRVLPEAAYLRVAERVLRANRVEHDGEQRGTEIDERLRRYFEQDGEELSRQLGRELSWAPARSAP